MRRFDEKERHKDCIAVRGSSLYNVGFSTPAGQPDRASDLGAPLPPLLDPDLGHVDSSHSFCGLSLREKI